MNKIEFKSVLVISLDEAVTLITEGRLVSLYVMFACPNFDDILKLKIFTNENARPEGRLLFAIVKKCKWIENLNYAARYELELSCVY